MENPPHFLISNFRSYLLEHGRSEKTATAYSSDVERYIAWCERAYGLAFTAAMLNRSDLHDYQVESRKNLRVPESTWNRYVASLSVFAAWLGVEIDGALTRAKGQNLAPRSLDESAYRRFRLTVREAVRTAKTTASRRQALRNAAVVALLVDAGLREGEIVHLRLEDVFLGERKGRIFICNAKGNKDRDVPINKDVVDTLKAWLAVRPTGCQNVFVGVRGDRLQERGIQKLVAEVARDAQIGHITPHQLRHTFCYRLYKDGIPLNVIAELAGHSTIDVTRRYTLPHRQDLEDAVGVLR